MNEIDVALIAGVVLSAAGFLFFDLVFDDINLGYFWSAGMSFATLLKSKQ